MEKYLSGNTRRMYRVPISRSVLFYTPRQLQVVDFTCSRLFFYSGNTFVVLQRGEFGLGPSKNLER